MVLTLNKAIADIFNEMAAMLSMDESPVIRFKIRAYQKAALTISTLQQPIEEIYKKGGKKALMDLPGIGEAFADKIAEYINTNKVKSYEKLKKRYPIDFTNLTRIQGFGAKRAIKLYKELGVKSIEDLKKAVLKHEIRGVEGFGEKSETEIQKGLDFLQSTGNRMLLGAALPAAESIVKQIRDSKLVREIVIAGSARRMKETVGDLDILIISDKAQRVMDFIEKMKEIDSILVKGPTKISVVLKIGLNCDFRVVHQDSFGAALQYFTGSKDHSVALRQITVRKGWTLNEYRLADKKGNNLASKTEEEVYNKLGMDYIEPEMREARGEIELAMAHKLPKLVKLEDLRGDLQLHTKYTDGANTIEEMAQKGMVLKYEYIGLTDHSKSEYVTGGMVDKEFMKYFNDIDKINEKLDGKIRLLKSGEADILKDGSMDLEKKTLEAMDYRLGAIHTNLKQGKDEMTKRVVKAFESGLVDIFAHPTERIINQRAPIPLDLDKVFQAAKDNGVIMEIDSLPDRLDLNDENIIRARQYGLRFCVDTDAHRAAWMELTRYGIGTARRGWLTKADLINTKPLKELLKAFSK